MVDLLMTLMFSIFTLAIKFDCLFLTVIQSFHLFVSFIFDKLTPLNILGLVTLAEKTSRKEIS